MFARLRRPIEDGEDGFAVIDLLIAMIIIGILASMAVPVLLNQRQKGWDAATKADLGSLAVAEETYMAGNGVYTSTKADLVAAGYKQTPGVQFQDGWLYTRTIVDDGPTGPHFNAVLPPGTGNHSYCLAMVSQSGRVIWYDSKQGGVQPYTWPGCTD